MPPCPLRLCQPRGGLSEGRCWLTRPAVPVEEVRAVLDEADRGWAKLVLSPEFHFGVAVGLVLGPFVDAVACLRRRLRVYLDTWFGSPSLEGSLTRSPGGEEELCQLVTRAHE